MGVSLSTGEPHWKRTLALIWLCQFLFQSSFSFGIPFAPFFMQSIGVQAEKLPLYVSLFGAAPALTTLLFSPFWGAMADRFGRKKMLLRCYFGGVIVLSGIGLCTSPDWMIFFRLLQGIVCGSIPAALTLASSTAPGDRAGFALGLVNSATFSGLLIGSFFGGIFADRFGCRIAFLVSGAPSLIAAAIMFSGVKEHFVPQIPRSGSALADKLRSMAPRRSQTIVILPLLLIMMMVMFCRQFDPSFIPLFVQEIRGQIEGSATWSGIISALSGVAGVLAGLLAGYFSDRVEPGKMAAGLGVAAALLLASLYFTPTIGYLVVMRTIANLAVDGVEPSLQVWLNRKIPASGRNLAFAWAASFRSVGWFLAPLAAGFIVRRCGIRMIFLADMVNFLIIVTAILWLYRRDRRHRRRRKI